MIRRPRHVFVALALSVAATPVVAQRVSPPISGDRWIVADGVWLRYRTIGTVDARSVPVVLLRGYTASEDPLLPLAESLGTTRSVVLFDQRGFGMSGKPLEANRYGEAFLDDVVLLLDGLGVPRADVVGYSLGGVVAAKLAVRYPTRVRRLVLIAAPIYRDSARLAQLTGPTVASLARGGGMAPLFRAVGSAASEPAARQMDAAMLRSNDRRALLASMQSLGQLLVRPRDVVRLAVPTLGVAGGRDPLVDATRELPAWWTGAMASVVEGATHDGVLGDGRMIERVRQFLAVR